jgi:hypothetical protein
MKRRKDVLLIHNADEAPPGNGVPFQRGGFLGDSGQGLGGGFLENLVG